MQEVMVAYHGSMTDDHGLYLASEDKTSEGRFSLRKKGEASPTLRNVRSKSFTLVFEDVLIDMPRENGEFRVVTCDDDDTFTHVFSVGSWATSWTCEKNGTFYDAANSVAFPKVRLGADDMIVRVLSGYAGDPRSGESYGFGVPVSIVKVR